MRDLLRLPPANPIANRRAERRVRHLTNSSFAMDRSPWVLTPTAFEQFRNGYLFFGKQNEHK
jgi:hypothetical protein